MKILKEEERNIRQGARCQAHDGARLAMQETDENGVEDVWMERAGEQ